MRCFGFPRGKLTSGPPRSVRTLAFFRCRQLSPLPSPCMASNADDFFAVQFMFDGLVTEAAALLAEEEEEEPEVSKSQFGLRRNKYGDWERSGGWEPEKRQ